MCVAVCISGAVPVCTCVGLCAHAWGSVHMCGAVCICVGLCAYVWGYVHMCGAVCICVAVCMHVAVSVFACLCPCTCVCSCVNVRSCVCAYLFVLITVSTWIPGPGLKFDLGLMAEVEESRQTVSLMPEYLVVCCWRSIKEVSLLLGELSQRVPITQPGAVSQGLFSLQQVRQLCFEGGEGVSVFLELSQRVPITQPGTASHSRSLLFVAGKAVVF